MRPALDSTVWTWSILEWNRYNMYIQHIYSYKPNCRLRNFKKKTPYKNWVHLIPNLLKLLFRKFWDFE